MRLDRILATFDNPPLVEISSGLLAGAEERVRALALGKRLMAVCDGNTRPLFGGRFPGVDWLELEGEPAADLETVESLRRASSGHDALIALGGGTIGDLCKYASFLDRKPYAVFPAAPSMNGYLSANASITVKGHKQSLPAQMPRAAFCDLDILCAAPERLIRSGLGDSLCRSTCQADWLLSHLLLDTPYDPLPFEWLLPYERQLFDHAGDLLKGGMEIMELLIATLLVSGLGMVRAGGSYPASQGEHLIAHAMEMRHGAALPSTYHGEQIAVTALTMAGRQQAMLASPVAPHLCHSRRYHAKADGDPKEIITAYFGPALASTLHAEYAKKLAAIGASGAAERLQKNWPDIRERIAAVTVPVDRLEAALKRAGCPVAPAGLGWREEHYAQAVEHSRFIRNRFTFLDMEHPPRHLP